MGNDKFIELVTKKLTGEISQEEATELKHVIDTQPSYKLQYEAFRAYWKTPETPATDNLVLFSKIQDQIKKIEKEQDIKQSNLSYLLSVRIVRNWPLAAALLLFIMGTAIYLLYFNPYPGERLTLHKRTSNGQKTTIILTDGTQVTLNAQSILTYPPSFTGNKREVSLTGEAYFDVKKDPSHPFIIHTSKMNLKVLGTAFNVKSYPRDSVIETTLLRGSIEVTLDDRPADRIMLKEREKLIVKNTNYKKEPRLVVPRHDTLKGFANSQYILTNLNYLHEMDSTVAETAWMTNQFIFRDESFDDLAKEMERWYGVTIIFKNQQVMNYSFSGVFEKETVTEALDALRMTEKFRYKVSKSIIYIF